MAVKIRLKRMGKIRAPYYRIVVADARTKRDGRVIEEIGKYHPKENPSLIEVDSERAAYWLGVGAQPSEPVAAILKVTGDWQKFKGEPAPPPMLMPEARRDKTERFNEALKDSRFEPSAEAVTPKRGRRSEPEVTEESGAESPAEQPAAPDQPVEGARQAAPEPAAEAEAPAADAGAAEAPAADAAPAEAAPAEAAPAEATPADEPES